MNSDEALGWVIVSVLNDHFPDPDQPDTWIDDDSAVDQQLGTAGCIVNCGPCKALHGLDEGGRATFEHLIRLTGFHEGGWSWWDSNASTVRWDVLEAYWAGHKTCGISNGKPTGCNFDEEES